MIAEADVKTRSRHPAEPKTRPAPATRIESIDLLRGLIMILMALDHTRDFFHSSGFNPRDVTDPALFLTRWITHICAPTFIFLAGLSAYLYGTHGRTTPQVSWFVLTRGLWLILLSLTLVHFAWSLSVGSSVFVLQVIWAIGASMVVLAGLLYLPLWAIGAVGLAMIFGHNLLDGVQAQQFGSLAWIWHILHQRGTIYPVPDIRLIVAYPLIPWIGVMAAGYALGPLYQLDPATRRRWLLGLGAAVTAGFFLLRATNLYGDPVAWSDQANQLYTLLSFLNCEKYPPSLLYLMMTLGPALLLLALFEGLRGRNALFAGARHKVAQWIIVFGRVPFFYYVIHLVWIQLLALAFALLTVGDLAWLTGGNDLDNSVRPHLSLAGVYVVWVIVVVTLYPICKWFARLKQTRNEWWWPYL